MFGWLEALILGVSAGILLVIILLLIIRRRFTSKQQVAVTDNQATTVIQSRTESLRPDAKREKIYQLSSIRKPSYHMFRRVSSTRPTFKWADHPSLIVDAVENGWSRFAFTNITPSSPSFNSSSCGSLLVTGDYSSKENNQVNLSWEVGQGSVDFMQKIRLKSGLCDKVNSSNADTAASSTIRMALPLPGPSLGSSYFPQEAYFEITLLNSREDDGQSKRGAGEGEKTKLIRQNNSNIESSVKASSSRGFHMLEELKICGGRRGEPVKMSVGLTVAGSPPLKIPGSYTGSVGFNSDGSVFLAGVRLAPESEKEDWAQMKKVIGCGFDPRKKKVLFTVDSELIHMIHCKSEDFGAPLYPVIASNIDITVLVNLGQGSFSYEPANAQRTPNPCFIGPVIVSSAAAFCYEDSGELFSMGTIDSEWLRHSSTIGSTISNNKMVDKDDESEADLFEIVLDRQGRSPIVV